MRIVLAEEYCGDVLDYEEFSSRNIHRLITELVKKTNRVLMNNIIIKGVEYRVYGLSKVLVKSIAEAINDSTCRLTPLEIEFVSVLDRDYFDTLLLEE